MISDGSKVQLHYTLTVEGEQIESSRGRDPLSYEHGRGQIIPGLEKALDGLDVGDTRQVTVEPAQAYGEHDPEAVQEVPKEAFQDVDQLSVGSMVQGQAADGRGFQAEIAAIGDETVTLDLNHPMAGKTLTFDVEVVAVS